MKRWLSLASLTLLAVAPQAAQAQFTGGYPRVTRPPTVSPFLDLGRSGSSAGIDYFTRVRPRMETMTALQDLQAGVNRVGPGTDDPTGASGAPVTGIPAYFGNYLHYFPAMPAPQVNPLMPRR